MRGVTRDEAYRDAGRLFRSDSGIDIFDSLPRIANVADFDRAFACSDIFEGYRVLSLRHVLAIKALAMVPNREKDHADMTALAWLIKQEEERGGVAWLGPALARRDRLGL